MPDDILARLTFDHAQSFVGRTFRVDLGAPQIELTVSRLVLGSRLSD